MQNQGVGGGKKEGSQLMEVYVLRSAFHEVELITSSLKDPKTQCRIKERLMKSHVSLGLFESHKF